MNFSYCDALCVLIAQKNYLAQKQILIWMGIVGLNYRQAIRVDKMWHRHPIGSLCNHDDDGNKSPTNLHIWQWKTVFLHALHVHFSSCDILKTFLFFLRREMTCFAVVRTTWAYDDKCSILSSYVPSPSQALVGEGSGSDRGEPYRHRVENQRTQPTFENR